MSITNENKTPRETILTQLAELDTIERGTLIGECCQVPSPDGNGTVLRGPYYKHQCWEDGKNRSVRVPAAQVARLRQDIENGKRFDQLTAQLAQLAVEKGRTERAALSATPAAATADDSKKNSTKNASPNVTAKPKPSSPQSAKPSRKKA
jgi:hypothetical protein